MTSDNKKVCIVTGTRAEYGLLKPLILQLQQVKNIDLCIVATGTHLSLDFGETYREIEADGFYINAKIKIPLDCDSHGGMVRSTGSAMIAFADYFEKHPPNLLVVLGDRFEILAVTTAAAMLCIPIAHISGGDTSEGAVDEFIRHSITKMSHLHFPTNELSRKRILQMGENPESVFNVGALNVDNILSLPLLSRKELGENLGFCMDDEYALITFHPVTMNDDTCEFSELLKAIDVFPSMKFLFTYANADAGGRAINLLIDEFVATRKNCVAYASLGNLRYLSAMKYAAVVIGNSSSGLYETPSFGVPCVNIGDRQRGRLCAENVINCSPYADEIMNAIKTALSPAFKEIACKTESPFGDGHAAERITEKIFHFFSCETIDVKKSFYLINCNSL
jgi:GDP/UDP-N,N'-diacetylbacillosamine 2-epimerase (hydrolysing)